jgi:AraC family transcriptional regulator
MADFDARPLAVTGTVSVWDVVCAGARRQRSDEECADDTHLVFPYRGAYVQHVGRAESVAEANLAIVINAAEPYRVSHPLGGGDAVVSVGASPETLVELTPPQYLRAGDKPALRRSHLRVGPDAQAITARLRHGLARGAIGELEAETLTLALLRMTLGGRGSNDRADRPRQRRLVDRAKLALASDLGRRWTLAEITAEVGGSPVYLTQLFQQLEGMPLYRYQLRLRLARALALLADYDDLSLLALDLGFSSHSHFSTSFKRAFGQSPSSFRRSVAG